MPFRWAHQNKMTVSSRTPLMILIKYRNLWRKSSWTKLIRCIFRNIILHVLGTLTTNVDSVETCFIGEKNLIVVLYSVINNVLLSNDQFSSHSQGGRAVAPAVNRWLPTLATRVTSGQSMWGLWCTKRHWDRFSPSTSVSPANHHSTNFSNIIINRGWLVAVVPSGPNWTPPPTIPIKKNM
jgi:hypothetical protein